jgi:hypothetical protein
MLWANVEGDPKNGEIGLAECLTLGWLPDRKPAIRNKYGTEVDTDLVKESDNQLALLDPFFGDLHPEESLCFFKQYGHG